MSDKCEVCGKRIKPEEELSGCERCGLLFSACCANAVDSNYCEKCGPD